MMMMSNVDTTDRKVLILWKSLNDINGYMKDIDIAEKTILSELKDEFSESFILNIVRNRGLSTKQKMSIFFKETNND